MRDTGRRAALPPGGEVETPLASHAAVGHDAQGSVAGGTFRAGAALAHLAAFGGFGLAVSSVYAFTGFGFPCPFRLVTGWQCPLCGGTRLGSALLQGDVASAFAYNPLVFVGLGVLLLLGVAWTIEALHGPALRPPTTWRSGLRRIRPTHWLALCLVLSACYTMLRNLI